MADCYLDIYNKGCYTYDCQANGDCVSTPTNKGGNIHHNIKTNYNLNIAGIVIPIINTNRVFDVVYKDIVGTPDEYVYLEPQTSAPYIAAGCTSSESKYKLTVVEDCTIITSVLHHIDIRYNVVLYKKTTDTIKLNKTSSETAAFKTTSGQELFNRLDIKEVDYTDGTQRIEEWVLSTSSGEVILDTVTTKLHPFGPKNTYGSLGTHIIDPEIREILIFDQPPSQADPLTPEVVALDFYDYANNPGEESELNREDGGNKDMFYPAWCRSLTLDPVWRAAADRRYAVTWFHEDIYSDNSYVPPSITVDPIPLGSFVKHPKVGEVYQFLINESIKSNVNYDALLKQTLGANTLYYPISLA